MGKNIQLDCEHSFWSYKWSFVNTRHGLSSVPRATHHRTHFGFGEVDISEKTDMIKALFAGVSDKYDVMNDSMSLGTHRIWKTAMVDWLAPRAGEQILDLAGGTGDIAMRILKRSPQSQLTVLDLTEEMMRRGQQRAKSVRGHDPIQWVSGDALQLPFANNSFDSCTIAFGIRNFTDIPRSLDEISRILKFGGRLLILEFSDVRNTVLRQIYDRYSFAVIPWLGQWMANDKESYRYLVESIRRFPKQEEFATMIEEVGFKRVKYRNLSMGIAALHSGWKV